MIQKASYSVALGVCWLLLSTSTLFGADPTKAQNWIDQLRQSSSASQNRAIFAIA